jgi:hypothetical protein
MFPPRSIVLLCICLQYYRIICSQIYLFLIFVEPSLWQYSFRAKASFWLSIYHNLIFFFKML